MKINLDNLTQEDIAKFIAYQAHRGQYRHDGVTPYITHPEAVANSFPKNEVYERAAAWLHDVLEKNEQFSSSVLLAMGIERAIILVVMRLTRKSGQAYGDYISRMMRDPMAVRVKIADIRHNLSGNPTESLKKRYLKTLKKLEMVEGI